MFRDRHHGLASHRIRVALPQVPHNHHHRISLRVTNQTAEIVIKTNFLCFRFVTFQFEFGLSRGDHLQQQSVQIFSHPRKRQLHRRKRLPSKRKNEAWRHHNVISLLFFFAGLQHVATGLHQLGLVRCLQLLVRRLFLVRWLEWLHRFVSTIWTS